MMWCEKPLCQEMASLLEKQPLEIKQQICEEVLGGRTFRLLLWHAIPPRGGFNPNTNEVDLEV